MIFMDTVTLIGSIAGLCTTVSLVPQVIKVYRMKETRDLSLAMYIIFSVGVFLWFIYGLIIKSMPIIAANGVTLTFSLFILVMKVKYK
jgi:MtN3 and saliva related transmembrane protein